MSLLGTQIIEEIERIVHEFGDAAVEMPDPIEATWRNSVDRVEYDSERERILFVSDR